jgi:hypothetical protein
MHELKTLLRERVASGLKRRAIKTCSEWAKAYRVMGQPFPGKWTFDHHPWAKDMCDCTAERMVGQKAAQLAFTEVALNKVFYNIDVKGGSCLYILPASTPDASDFSTSRFDPALDLSDHLKGLFSDVKNIGHKRAGSANLFIRGSRSRSQLKSLPVGTIIFDEVDEMKQENVPLAFERMSGQVEKQAFLLSTPTIPKFGINNFFLNSTQDHYFFKCPGCSRLIELTWPDCFELIGDSEFDPRLAESFIKCGKCKKRLSQDNKAAALLETGRWVSGYTDRLDRGFYVNQLYSKTISPRAIAELFVKAQSNPASEQEFYNSKMGLTRIVEGAKITDKHLDECAGNFKKQDVSPAHSLITMGIDVGKWLHVEIDRWTIDNTIATTDITTMARCQVIADIKVRDFEELDRLMREYRVAFAVIDANPERRKALEFAERFYGRVRLCFYGRGVATKQIHLKEEEEHTMTVDRTSWLDASLGRFRTRRISLPIDISTEYKNHIKEPIRVYEKDKDGNPTSRYVSVDDDHYAHARNYAEIALPLAASMTGHQDVTGVY